MHCVSDVQVFLGVAYSDREDLFPVCPAGAQELPENPPSLTEAAGVLPGCDVVIDASAFVPLRGFAQGSSYLYLRRLGVPQPRLSRSLGVSQGDTPPHGDGSSPCSSWRARGAVCAETVSASLCFFCRNFDAAVYFATEGDQPASRLTVCRWFHVARSRLPLFASAARDNPRLAAARWHAAARFGTRSSRVTASIFSRFFWKQNGVSTLLF